MAVEVLEEQKALDPEMVSVALEAVMTHLDQEGDLRSHAIAQGLIDA
jgi:hypothetical protein